MAAHHVPSSDLPVPTSRYSTLVGGRSGPRPLWSTAALRSPVSPDRRHSGGLGELFVPIAMAAWLYPGFFYECRAAQRFPKSSAMQGESGQQRVHPAVTFHIVPYSHCCQEQRFRLLHSKALIGSRQLNLRIKLTA